MAAPFHPVADGVRVSIRVAPKASRNAVTGVADAADGLHGAGGRVLKVSVTAAPEDGKANAAVIELLAKQWRVPKSSVSVVQGHTDRNKTLHVAGPPADLLARLRGWAEGLK